MAACRFSYPLAHLCVRGLVLFGALAALSACGDREGLQPFTDSRPPAALPTRFYAPEGWTWGLLQVGEAPAVRYGVGAPRREHRGEVVVVPDAGEPAEVWFETANALIAQDWGFWIVDLQGQGGSGRATSPRDLLHADDFSADAAAVRALALQAARAAPDRPVVVLGSSVGAAVVADALAAAPPGVSGAVLSAPLTAWAPGREPGSPETARWMRRLGLGDGFAHGQQPWTSSTVRSPLVTHDPLRASAGLEWMRANPELRTGGVSWAWIAAFDALAARLRTPGALRAAGVPVLTIAPAEDAWAAPGSAVALCRSLPRCTLQSLPGSRAAPHLEADPIRARWLAAVLAFAEARRSAAAPAVAMEPSQE